jgi:hypothetical protein
MEKFEHKVLETRMSGLLRAAWFTGDQELGEDLETILNRFGEHGWQVATRVVQPGVNEVILKRRC